MSIHWKRVLGITKAPKNNWICILKYAQRHRRAALKAKLNQILPTFSLFMNFVKVINSLIDKLVELLAINPSVMPDANHQSSFETKKKVGSPGIVFRDVHEYVHTLYYPESRRLQFSTFTWPEYIEDILIYCIHKKVNKYFDDAKAFEQRVAVAVVQRYGHSR